MEDVQGHPGVPLVPGLLEALLPLLALLALFEDDGDRHHLLAQRERLGDGVLAQA